MTRKPKQPHVWVVEQQYANGDWVARPEHGFGDYVSMKPVIKRARFYSQNLVFRLAKYRRVE